MDTSIDDDVPDLAVDIVPDGDVVLVVDKEKARLRVSSQSLRYSSKVFSAMFGPGWYDLQRLSKEFPAQVALLDDDAEAMRTSCCFIHLRNDLVPDTLTTREILQTAIEVDKYDLRVALKYASSEWLRPDITMELEEKGRILAAAYLFENTDGFMAYSKMLILDHCESYLDLASDATISQILPSGTFLWLEERRTKLRLKLHKELTRAERDEICACGWGKICREVVQGILLDSPPLETLYDSIST